MRLRFFILAASLLAILLVPASARALTVISAPALDHPRLWLRPADVIRLRGWAAATSPLYADGLAPVVERAKQDMDDKHVPQEDCGQRAYTEYPTEAYASLFAFMSLIDPDEAARVDYAKRARTLLMHVMNLAAKGPAKDTERIYKCPGDTETLYFPPFRDPIFFTEDSDRLRWHGESFPLTVDWIYPSLSKEDKVTIAKVFTRWGAEIIASGYHHPEPVNVTRSKQLTDNREQVRWAGNNYFAAHMRNLGMMSLALDPADSTPQLQDYLRNATGAWLYLFDALTRTDSRGGLLPEGLEYSPQTASYVIQFLLALKTAGQADAKLHGPEVLLDTNPFWDDMVAVYLHTLSPATVDDPERGPVYQPAWYGDGQRYQQTDFIDAFGSLGLYDQVLGNGARLNALRYIQTNLAPGGPERLLERARGADYFRSTLLYFTLFDPAGQAATDPRKTLLPNFVAPGVGRLYSRTGWDKNAAWLTYSLSWNQIDHQMADGNNFEFYRGGEWLTKARVGYANIAEGIASSEFRNTLAIQNKRPADRTEDDWRIDLWKRGSQWNLVNSGDPGALLHSFGADYTYAGGDATNLYNSVNESATDVRNASRALVWLKPDIIVIYDRADAPAERFKRVWFQLPATATVNGIQAIMNTAKQSLIISALLPQGAKVRMANPNQENIGETADPNDPMKQRLVTEAPATPKARFLHVLQGADKATVPVLAAAPGAVIRNTAGSPFEGVVIQATAILFPVDAGASADGLTYTATVETKLHLITGLEPGAKYTVTLKEGTVTLRKGGEQAQVVDMGGVLVIRAQ